MNDTFVPVGPRLVIAEEHLAGPEPENARHATATVPCLCTHQGGDHIESDVSLGLCSGLLVPLTPVLMAAEHRLGNNTNKENFGYVLFVKYILIVLNFLSCSLLP